MSDDFTAQQTTTPGRIFRAIEKNTNKLAEVMIIDQGGGTGTGESIVSLGNGLMIQGTVTIQDGGNSITVDGVLVTSPKTPFTFRTRLITQAINQVLVAPGAPWRLTSISLISGINAGTPDNPSILIGIHPTVTPTGAQVVYADPSFPVSFRDHVVLADLAEGGAGDKLLITSGVINSDIIEVFGTGYLK